MNPDIHPTIIRVMQWLRIQVPEAELSYDDVRDQRTVTFHVREPGRPPVRLDIRRQAMELRDADFVITQLLHADAGAVPHSGRNISYDCHEDGSPIIQRGE